MIHEFSKIVRVQSPRQVVQTQYKHMDIITLPLIYLFLSTSDDDNNNNSNNKDVQYSHQTSTIKPLWQVGLISILEDPSSLEDKNNCKLVWTSSWICSLGWRRYHLLRFFYEHRSNNTSNSHRHDYQRHQKKKFAHWLIWV